MSTSTLPAMEQYIDGTWRLGRSDASLEIVDPATERRIGTLQYASDEDVELALGAAARHFGAWRDTFPAVRTGILVEAAQLVRRNAAYLAELTTLELGMRVTDARVLVERAADVLEWDANEGRRLYGRVVPSEAGVRRMVVREPIGPVAAFSPWNGSIFTPCRKIGSALGAGCTLILKAAEETPLSTIALVKLFEAAGVPKGVLNLVYGDPSAISKQLIESPIIRMISFTGSVPIGKRLTGMAAPYLKPTLMELGGHAPVIVCRDADPAVAAERLVAAKFFNAGQICFAPSRVFVDHHIAASFVAAVVERAQRIRAGSGFESTTDMGPMATLRRLCAVDALVTDAIDRGAQLRTGGRRLESAGWFYPATVLEDVPREARLLQDEPFGPVLAINRFRHLDEALFEANSLPYGLAAYAFTDSAATADRITRALECGMVGINTFGVSTHGMPFGGVKESGSGREGGMEGIASHTIVKTVTHAFS